MLSAKGSGIVKLKGCLRGLKKVLASFGSDLGECCDFAFEDTVIIGF